MLKVDDSDLLSHMKGKCQIKKDQSGELLKRMECGIGSIKDSYEPGKVLRY